MTVAYPWKRGFKMTVLFHKSPHLLAHKQSGLSLVELMIALALGLVLTLGVTQVFLGSNKTYRTSDAIGFLQENLRFSMSRISRDARMAGNQGCLVGQPTDHLDTTDTAYDSLLWAPGQAVIGWEAPNTGLGKKLTLSGFTAGGGNWTTGSADAAPATIVSNALRGTDFIVLTGSERADVVLQGNPSATVGTISTQAATGINAETIILAVVDECNDGARFQNTNSNSVSGFSGAGSATPGNSTTPDFSGYNDEASVYVYRSRGYYIGIGADGGPALFRMPLTPGEGTAAVELVSGVENMQILYGVAGSQRAAERYVPASAVADWDDVVSVRVGLLMRSGDQILEEDNAETFNLVGTEIDPGADRRARLVATTTIGIRNRLE